VSARGMSCWWDADGGGDVLADWFSTMKAVAVDARTETAATLLIAAVRRERRVFGVHEGVGGSAPARDSHPVARMVVATCVASSAATWPSLASASISVWTLGRSPGSFSSAERPGLEGSLGRR
jgi:hypothetical protein